MKKIVIIQNEKLIEKIKNNIDGIILSLKKLSTNSDTFFTLSEIKSICEKYPKLEVFISLNKNLDHQDLNYLESILEEINSLKIKAILFYDLSIVSYKDKGLLKHDLVWAQEHMSNNYISVEAYKDLNCQYAFLSSEITAEDINLIKKQSSIKLMALVLGFVPIFTSKRKLISSYLENFNLESKTDYYMKKENKEYMIIENENTVVYSPKILNYIDKIKLDYQVYNAFKIEEEKFVEIINDNLNYEEVNNLLKEKTDEFFLKQNSVYKEKL